MDSSRSPVVGFALVAVTSLVLISFIVWPFVSTFVVPSGEGAPTARQPLLRPGRHPHGRAARVRLIERQTARLRHLRPLHAVPVTFLHNRRFNHFVSGVSRKSDSARQIRIAHIESVLAGLLPPSVNLTKIVTQGLTKEVVGLYDRHRKHLYIRDTGQALGIDRWLIAHEFTHALQDQHFHLNRVEPSQSHRRIKNSDATLAEVSLVEGDAVDIQYNYLYRYYTRPEAVALQRQVASYPSPHIPPIVNEQFMFPYTNGPTYVQYLLSHGGYRRVDTMFRHPQQTTYQIMFPGRRIRPAHLVFGKLRGNYRAGKVVDDDVDGAFGYKQLVEKYVPASLAMHLASLWRGDRYLLLRNRKHYAMYMESIYAHPRAAQAGARIIRASLRGRFRRSLQHNQGVAWAGRASIFGAVATRSRRVTLAFGPSTLVVRRLVRAKTR